MLEVLLWAWLSGRAGEWLAQAPSPIPGPGVWESYGPGGLLAAVMAGFCWLLFSRYEKSLDLERQEKRELRTELAELNKKVMDLTMPTLTQSSAALKDATAAVTEVMRVLRKEDR